MVVVLAQCLKELATMAGLQGDGGVDDDDDDNDTDYCDGDDGCSRLFGTFHFRYYCIPQDSFLYHTVTAKFCFEQYQTLSTFSN